jgi:hypothetical protein
LIICLKDFDMCNKDKLIDVALCIFNNFATSNDIDNIIVSRSKDDDEKEVCIQNRHYKSYNKLSYGFGYFSIKKVAISSSNSHIKIPLQLKQTLDSMKKQTKYSTSVVYRTLITGVLRTVDDYTLGNYNSIILTEKYPEIIKACNGTLLNFLNFQINEIYLKT